MSDSLIQMRTGFDVNYVDHFGSDEMICRAARVSTLGAASLDTVHSQGLIRFLMRNRHGSPFEHGGVTMRITAPIFVWREFMRHRIGFSYNEQSGRYMELEPVFYVPPVERPLVQEGKAGEYIFVEGTQAQGDQVYRDLTSAYEQAWISYQHMLSIGIAKEVARMCLPVATYSTAYVTCNPRSIMSFLSLRTKSESSLYKSYPQWEIEQVANQIEALFGDLWPMTHNAFEAFGRMAP